MTQPQNMTVDASSESVTDSGVEASAADGSDAESRDCDRCGKAIPVEEPVCILGRWGSRRQEFIPCCTSCAEMIQRDHDRRLYDRRHTEGEDSPWVAQHNTELADYDPWRSWHDRACAVCSRPIRVGGKLKVCSSECRSQLPATLARDRRDRMREAVTPGSFTCVKCEQEIEDTIAFWWDPNASWQDRDLTPWCEPCFAADRIESARKRYAESDDGRDFFGGKLLDPDAAGYDPFASIAGYDPTPCGDCGRVIRWSFRHRLTGSKDGRYCCERCFYESRLKSRRVEPTERKCESCGKTFTPKRSDAKTCSDKCRQALSRSRRNAKKRVTATRDRRTGSASGDAANRDKRRKGSR